jgi:hypothetical protein
MGSTIRGKCLDDSATKIGVFEVSKLILVCSREGTPSFPEEALRRIADRLAPKNIAAHPPHIGREFGVLTAMINPSTAASRRRGAICLGQLLGSVGDWTEIGADAPDGTYLICRSDLDRVEILTDVFASRTAWYCSTAHMFAASTSQRALVALLGSFEMNQDALGWMISTGSLGPGGGWDRRLRRLDPDSRLTLARGKWQISIERKPVAFIPSRDPESTHSDLLIRALQNLGEEVAALDSESWRLPLSGGVDSRALLLSLLRANSQPRCITWGRQAALSERESDAYVARQLAAHLNVAHEYIPLDLPTEPATILLDRFLEAGEGRVDHISGYMDGFEIWRRLFTANVAGIVRGDEAFGWNAVACERQVRYDLGLHLLSDYFGPNRLAAWDLPPQAIPADLQRHTGETLALWRDRVYQQHRIPVVLAALNDLKSGYVEIVSPLLSRKIIELVRRMPDQLRTEKRLFRGIVRAISPPVPFARVPAITSPRDVFATAAFRRLMKDELETHEARMNIPRGLRTYVLGKLSAQPDRRFGRFRLGPFLQRAIPSVGVVQIKKMRPLMCPAMDSGVLAFRASLVSRMARMLTEDAALLKTRPVLGALFFQQSEV